MDCLQTILKKYWGYTSFRAQQLDIIRAVMARRDCVALLPTGGGKSLTYQLPALAQDGVAIVITPLIALMRDQVEALRARGVKAVAINSAMSFAQIDIALDNCAYGDVKLLYIAPERIDTLVFRSRLRKMNVSLVAIDEAHCISEWGYDFRPSYLRIASLRELLPGVPFLALTATATTVVLDDIIRHTALCDPLIFRASFARANLSFVVREVENKYEQMLRIVDKVAGSGIVYCRTRKQTQEVADFLASRAESATFYHAGLDPRLRTKRQEQWRSGDVRIIVATNAFGMGIDKADVRFVIHFAPPASIEAYYQEAGRAGRDGQRAWAVMLYNAADEVAIDRRLELEFPPVKEIKRIYDALFNFLQISIGGGKNEIYDFDLMAFAVYSKTFSLTAYNALKILELGGYMTLTDQAEHKTRIMFRIQRDDLYRFRVENAMMDRFLTILLRNYTGLFSDFVAVDEAFLASATGYTELRVVELLLTLSRAQIIKYIPRRVSPLIVFDQERLPIADVLISAPIYARRREQSALRSAAVVAYAQNRTLCRSVILQNYFDERLATPCGVCDVCLAKKAAQDSPCDSPPANSPTIQEQVMELLRSAVEYDLRSMVSAIDGPASVALLALRDMIARGQIEQLGSGVLKIKIPCKNSGKERD
ncbi:MAG: ATP-dependent DNA helicase RecQ [Mucinivorans sp.]